MSIMDKMVNECIMQHEGGEKFFDAIDEQIRNARDIFLTLESMAVDIFDDNGSYSECGVRQIVVVSGQFGSYFTRHILVHEFDTIIAVEGGLRKNDFAGFGIFENYIRNNDVVFIDDSFYSGTTRDKIQKEVERLGGNFLGTAVAYDGSLKQQDNVHSMYRYYK